MGILEHNAIMAKKVASEMSPFELRIEKKRRMRSFNSMKNLALLEGKHEDMSNDDLYQKFIDCKINIDDLKILVNDRINQQLSILKNQNVA